MMENASAMDTFDPDSAESRAIAQQEAELVAQGKPTVADKPMNFYGFGSSTEQFMLPDGIQYLEYKILNSGERNEFEQKTQRRISVHQASKKMDMNLDPVKEREVLLSLSVVGWHLFKPNKDGELVPHPFSKPALNEFLRVIDPAIVVDLEQTVRKANKWMMGDSVLEDLYEQREALEAEIAELEAIEGEG